MIIFSTVYSVFYHSELNISFSFAFLFVLITFWSFIFQVHIWVHELISIWSLSRWRLRLSIQAINENLDLPGWSPSCPAQQTEYSQHYLSVYNCGQNLEAAADSLIHQADRLNSLPDYFRRHVQEAHPPPQGPGWCRWQRAPGLQDWGGGGQWPAGCLCSWTACRPVDPGPHR